MNRTELVGLLTLAGWLALLGLAVLVAGWVVDQAKGQVTGS